MILNKLILIAIVVCVIGIDFRQTIEVHIKEENSYGAPRVRKNVNVEQEEIEDQLELDLNMQTAEIANSNFNHQQKAINSNSNPSLALKQQNNHDDPSRLDSKIDLIKQQNDYLFMFIVAGCAIAGVVALIAAGVCWYTVHKSSRTIVLSEYGTKGNSGSKLSLNSGDRRLAQSAQMYHYQHQKQQMIAMEKANNDTKPDNSDNSDDETEEGERTVYECPGLAPTGEMEVKNPFFREEFSSHNIGLAAASSTNNSAAVTGAQPPPAYSTLQSASNVAAKPEETLVQIENEKAKDSIVIPVNEETSAKK